MDLALMVEGQDGVNWNRWQRIARAAEDLGFAGLYRSDHFTNSSGPMMDSLELWVSLTWLASNTRRIEFGSLVTPTSFRHPVFTARMAMAVDDLSGGRLWLGVGAGWQEREHHEYGFDLLDPTERFARFHESVQVITALLRKDEPVNFDGQYYCLRGARLLPRPHRPGGPPVVIGGNGPRVTLPLVARYADEWNGVFLTPEKYKALNKRLDELLLSEGREHGDVRRTLMTNITFGRNDQEVRQNLNGQSAEDRQANGMLVGTASEIIDQLSLLKESGAQRVMLQWMDLDDMVGLEALAKSVLPLFR